MDEKIKELLDMYERFEDKKSAQGALDFVMRNAGRFGAVMPVGSALPTEALAVDLGLPSGRLWADRNVGAASPEEPGLYFSWGNTQDIEFGKVCDFSNKVYDETEGAELKCDIDEGHDAATVNMGAPWRMPTNDDFMELDKYCKHEWVEQNGYYGMRFTSNVNGNSIFFAASGLGYGSSWNYRGSGGYYWSASFSSARDARSLSFSSGGVDPQDDYYRYYGFAVRAVQN